MQGQKEKKLPAVGFKKLKKVLKKCRRDSQSQKGVVLHAHASIAGVKTCPDHCPGDHKLIFFSSLYQSFNLFFLAALNRLID